MNLKLSSIVQTAICFILAVVSLGLALKLYQNQQELEALLVSKGQVTGSTIAPVVERLVTAHPTWSNVESVVRDAVPQVFANKAAIDVLQPQRSPAQYQTSGSGFFINDSGEFITNAHVIDQARSIWIQIPSCGREQYEAELVGVTHDRDIALLKLKPEAFEKIKQKLGKISYLKLSNSDHVHPADNILAVGYPLGQKGIKYTAGVVSGREGHLIQIDAAINPGSSGGPSVNLTGEVIGINTAGITEAQNVGYIIPINELKIVIDDLRKVKLLRKPYLGVFFNNGSSALTDYFGNPQPGGLFVVDVYKDSPLQKAGIKKHDMIYEINGHRLDIYGEMDSNGSKISLIDYISQLKLGQTINLVVYRKGERKEISLTFHQADLLSIHKIYPGYEELDYEIVGGMLVQPLMLNHVARLVNNCPGLTRFAEPKFQEDPSLIITHIFIDSQAHHCRTLVPGCVLSKVNGKKVATLDELRTALFESFETGKIVIQTKESFYVVFELDKVINQAERLASDYFYNITPGMKSLIHEYKQRNNEREKD